MSENMSDDEETPCGTVQRLQSTKPDKTSKFQADAAVRCAIPRISLRLLRRFGIPDCLGADQYQYLKGIPIAQFDLDKVFIIST